MDIVFFVLQKLHTPFNWTKKNSPKMNSSVFKQNQYFWLQDIHRITKIYKIQSSNPYSKILKRSISYKIWIQITFFNLNIFHYFQDELNWIVLAQFTWRHHQGNLGCAILVVIVTVSNSEKPAFKAMRHLHVNLLTYKMVNVAQLPIWRVSKGVNTFKYIHILFRQVSTKGWCWVSLRNKAWGKPKKGTSTWHML